MSRAHEAGGHRRPARHHYELRRPAAGVPLLQFEIVRHADQCLSVRGTCREAAGLELEVRVPGERRRIVIDADGRFAAEGLPPAPRVDLVLGRPTAPALVLRRVSAPPRHR